MHINKSLKKIVESYKLQKSLLKKELEHDEIRTLGKLEKMNGYLMLKMTYYQLLSVMLDTTWGWKN